MQLKTTKIEWCTHTWNPVSGCYHGCEYCYARRMTARFAPHGERFVNPQVMKTEACGADGTKERYILEDIPILEDPTGKRRKSHWPMGFAPTFHTYTMLLPEKMEKPCRIFVSSMGDMFGEWVPDEWIRDVFDACIEAPQHVYYFLTKNPQRYVQLAENGGLPERNNFWYGSSTTTMDAPLFYSDRHNTFVSVEPILEPFRGGNVAATSAQQDWIIIGAETGQRKGKVVPERSWLEELVDTDTPIFMKDSLKPIWGENLLRQYPKHMMNVGADHG